MDEIVVENAVASDFEGILRLYGRVAAVAGGLARMADEIDERYVRHFMTNSASSGIEIVAREGERIVGEIHAYAIGPRVFAHVLGELTIAVDPDFQRRGVGRRIFGELMRQVVETRDDILRVELIARESNAKAIAFYESLGFVREGRLTARIASADGRFEADIPMAWHRKQI